MKFEEVRDKILEKLKSKDLKTGEGLILLEGFVNQSLAQSIGEIVIGGPTIPMIMTIGKDTGRIYFFALNALGVK